MDKPLYYEELVRCKSTRARVGKLRLKATSYFGLYVCEFRFVPLSNFSFS